jgi:8-oxo-dGTP pyrophosphatase MutT (NUDIX family)
VYTVFSSGLVVTSDDKIVLGKMAQHTSRAGKMQLSGGGLEYGDLDENSIFDMKHSLSKEIEEELGIDINDNDLINYVKFHCLKSGGNGNIAVVYQIDLKLSAKEFLQKYILFTEQLNQKNILSEFEKIIFVSATESDIEKFAKKNKNKIADYIPGVLASVAK